MLALAENALLYSRRHPRKNIRWRYPEHFPYRVIYEVLRDQNLVVVAAVIHAARQERHWQKLVEPPPDRSERIVRQPF
ncbi:MAG: type II toxin-antitoxin system RelE/ParE family toxin [Verrucomicrobia bacterium]|nr:type II toxin-antitoxin system RelE/ParE family toxin [Verrucomicrobiota bacterium]